MRVLITGDRKWDDPEPIEAMVDGLDPERDLVIEGECVGADLLGKEVALSWCISVEGYPAKWDEYGKAAGVIRNQQMLDEGKPDVVWAFHDDLKNSKGTKDMVKRALKARLPVYLVSRPRLEDLD